MHTCYIIYIHVHAQVVLILVDFYEGGVVGRNDGDKHYVYMYVNHA